MADPNKGSATRDYRGTEGAVDDAQEAPTPSETRLARGRIGVSRVKSPRTGVRSVDPDSAVPGSEGEPSYGGPMDTPAPQTGVSAKRKAADDAKAAREAAEAAESAEKDDGE